MALQYYTGPTNSLLDVGGLRIGQAHDTDVKTGVTIIVPNSPTLCAVDVRGGGPGTRETDTLDYGNLVDHVHAIVLSGGSVYGLDAASAITHILGSHRIGYDVGAAPIPVSPIVPAAILFDNANGGDKNWGQTPPYYRLAQDAYATLSQSELNLGAAGAGYGATAGLYKGGLGSASERLNAAHVGALMAVNPVGSPYIPGTNCFWAWPHEIETEYGGVRPPATYSAQPARDTKLEFLKHAGRSTLIGVVGTNVALTQPQLKRLAIMAQDGIAMSVQPSHTPLDGDTIFAVSTGDIALEGPVHLAELGAAAARCVARSVARGIFEAGQ